MRSYTEPELGLMLLYALPGENRLRESLFRRLSVAVKELGQTPEPELELDEGELQRLGCTRQETDEILRRLTRRQLLQGYLQGLSRKGIRVITRISPEYPQRLRETLGDRAPLVLFCAGALSLMERQCMSLVGSRKLRPAGKNFARCVGNAAARQGYCYCSGGAAGADTEGFCGAMEQGGCSVLFLADSLEEHLTDRRYRRYLRDKKLLLVSEQGPDLPFSTPRAMSRNRLIHAMGQKVFVAQSDYGTGGTWNGTMENLKEGWSPVFVYDGEPEEPGTRGLLERGAEPVSLSQLEQLSALGLQQTSLF